MLRSLARLRALRTLTLELKKCKLLRDVDALHGLAKLSLLDTILADMNPEKPETHAKFSTP